MNCQMCSQPYSLFDQNKMPHVLIQCGHTFCFKCINDNITSFEQQKYFQINCNQCYKINTLQNGHFFPINQTLIAIIKDSKKQDISENGQQDCTIHRKKVEAFCQNQQALLCLNCILAGHKNHKVFSIAQKVQMEKIKMKNYISKITDNRRIIQTKLYQSDSIIDKLSLDMNQFIFQVNLFFKNIICQLKESQEGMIEQTKKSIQKSIQQIINVQNQLTEKKLFYDHMEQISNKITQKTGVDFLGEYNKRLFIAQNCDMKQKYEISYKRIELNKEKILIQTMKSLEGLLQFQKKNSKTNNLSKANNLNKLQNTNNKKDKNNSDNVMNQKIDKDISQKISKTMRESRKQTRLLKEEILTHRNDRLKQANYSTQSFVKSEHESPMLPKGVKQPQVLQVNLLQKFQRHQKTKNMKKRKSEIISSSSMIKSPKIEYEVKRESCYQTILQSQETNQYKSRKPSGRNKNSDHQQLCESSPGIHLKKSSTAADQYWQSKIISNNEKFLEDLDNNESRILNPIKISPIQSKIKRQECVLSFLNDSKQFHSPNQVQNRTFQAETPLQINSFMESSGFTIPETNISNFNKQFTILQDSMAQLTMLCLEDTVYHFGGVNTDFVECLTIHHVSNNIQHPSNHNSLILKSKIFQGIRRSKFQCVVLKNYSEKKILIVGGKSANGQRCKEIHQFNTQKNKFQKSQLQLIQPISGCGVIVHDSKMYVFGGNAEFALKSMFEYKICGKLMESRKLSSMINSRDQLGFALGFDGFIYACGGRSSSDQILNSCERYCFKTNKWHSIPAMKTPRRSFRLISLPNALYAIGGHDGNSYIKTVEMYDFQKGRWDEVAPLNQGRFTHSAICTKDYQNILVFGGFYQNSALKSVQIYDVIENKWSYLENMKTERYLHNSILIRS